MRSIHRSTRWIGLILLVACAVSLNGCPPPPDNGGGGSEGEDNGGGGTGGGGTGGGGTGGGGGGGGNAQLLGTLELGALPLGFALQPSNNTGMVVFERRVQPIDADVRQAISVGAGAAGEFLALDSEDDLYATLDPEDGQVQDLIGYQTNLSNAESPFGMTYDPDTHSVFVVDVAPLGRKVALFQVDLDTFERTLIGEPGLGADLTNVFSLARDPDSGMLYTVDVEDFLWRIDPNTATATKVGPFIGFTDIQGLSFSPDGTLYGIHNVPPATLVRINTTTGIATPAASLPVSFGAGSLAFKPDGTLWTVELLEDRLVEINPNSGVITTEFDPLPVLRPSAVGFYMRFINALTFIPDGLPGGYVNSNLDIDAAKVLPNGDVIVSAGSDLIRLNGADLSYAASNDLGSLLTFRTILHDPNTNLIYVRDGLDRVVFELDAETLEVQRKIQFDDPRNGFFHTETPLMALDSQGGQLFVRDEGVLFRIDLDALAGSAVSEMAIGGDPQGVAVDKNGGVLIVNDLAGDGGASLRSFDLGTLEELAQRSLGNQIHNYAVDPDGGRLAVNVRVTTSFDTQVFLLDSVTLASLPLTFTVSGEDEPGSTSADLAIDPANNQLILTRAGEPNRVEFYALP